MKLLRRLLPLLVAALLLALPTQASAALVCERTSQGNTNTSSCDTTAGAAKLIVIGQVEASFTGNVPQDSPGNVYTQLTPLNCSNREISLWYKIAPTTSASHTWRPNGLGTSTAMYVWVFDNASPVLDQQSVSGCVSGSATVQPASITPGAANNILTTVVGNDIHTPITVDAPFGANQNATTYDKTTNGMGAGASYLIQTAATPRQPTWTAASNDTFMMSVMASFTYSSGSPPATCTSTLSTFGVSQCGEERR